MGLLDELSDSIANTTRDIGKMAQNAGDMTKLQYDKKVKEGELIKLYEKLGRKYYEEHKEEELEEIKEIKACELRLKELSDDIMTLKGGMACPNCGALVKTGSKYCSACGVKINDMFEE
ncbi:MAG: zinc ribbon domain-containing protein [Pseudobutyrivibrio ruminis]|nr:zinc ribbon domain-containing protein [Pseudobutyrivibrio ruminis]MBO6128172.1 zinc ribbon domain-containing protein [Pseudobutyrivibrio sp.]